MGKPPKKKAKRNNIRWDAFMRTKLVFGLMTNYYQLFHNFFNERDTSRSPGHPGVPRSYKLRMKYVSGKPGHHGTPGSYKQALKE